jgi:hypothetical protein
MRDPRRFAYRHRGVMRRVLAPCAALGALSLAMSAYAADALPSWNDGPAKQSIVSFVDRVTKQGSADFVPAPERIATFDNDGTLWSEQPMYFQLAFVFDRVKALGPKHPEWKTQEPFASATRARRRAGPSST